MSNRLPNDLPGGQPSDLPNNDNEFDALLRSFDPNTGSSDIPAIERLTSHWHAVSQDFENSSVVLSGRQHNLGKSKLRVFAWQNFAIAATIALILLGSVAWLRNNNNSLERSPVDRNIVDAGSNKLKTDRSLDSLGNSENAIARLDSASKEIDPNRLVSVSELLALSPKKANRYLATGDLSELKLELKSWLSDWYDAEPSEHEKMALQWRENRAYWLPWVKAGMADWSEVKFGEAAMELVVMDQGNQAFEWLVRCSQIPRLRPAAWRFLSRISDDSQLVGLIPFCESCDELQSIAMSLAERSSVIATQALANIASTPDCAQVLAHISAKWNPIHQARAFETLTSKEDENAYQAAMLLAAIGDTTIDRELNQRILQGRDRIVCAAVLILRNTEESQTALESMKKVRNLAAGLPSSMQQVQRWNTENFNVSSTRNEVCRLCVTAS